MKMKMEEQMQKDHVPGEHDDDHVPGEHDDGS